MSDELVYRLAKLKLKENLLRNKGYILEGYPRTYADCQNMFYTEMNTHDRKLGPRLAIKLNVSSEEVLKKRASQVGGERYADKYFLQRIKNYFEKNNSKDQNKITDYFYETKVNLIEIEAEEELEKVIRKSKTVLFSVA